jgi:hypothetical protein
VPDQFIKIKCGRGYFAEDGMGEACSMYGEDEKLIQYCGQKTCRKENMQKT